MRLHFRGRSRPRTVPPGTNGWVVKTKGRGSQEPNDDQEHHYDDRDAKNLHPAWRAGRPAVDRSGFLTLCVAAVGVGVGGRVSHLCSPDQLWAFFARTNRSTPANWFRLVADGRCALRILSGYQNRLFIIEHYVLKRYNVYRSVESTTKPSKIVRY